MTQIDEPKDDITIDEILNHWIKGYREGHQSGFYTTNQIKQDLYELLSSKLEHIVYKDDDNSYQTVEVILKDELNQLFNPTESEVSDE